MERGRDDQTDEDPKGGLICGLEPYHLRLLIDDLWVGGCGFSGNVGDLTLDQIFFRLADRKLLKSKASSSGVKRNPLSLMGKVDEDGMIRGRAADGTPIKGRIRGKSVARQLMEEEAEKKKQKRRRKS